MPLTLLSIGGSDLTQYMDIQNYTVNNTPEFETWTDANRIEHRHKFRDRLEGSLKIGFRSSTEISTFLTLLSNNIQSGGYYIASVYSNDDDTLHTGVNIYLDGVTEIKRDLTNGRIWSAYDLTLRER